MASNPGKGEGIASRSCKIGQRCVPETIRLKWLEFGALVGVLLVALCQGGESPRVLALCCAALEMTTT